MKISFDDNCDINFYFSFQCPYSYLAWKQICDLLKDNDKITLNPINIGINPPSNNSFTYREYWGKPRWERIAKEANNLNIIIEEPEKIVSEEVAARAITSSEKSGVEYYISTIFKAVFSKKQDISISTLLRYYLQSEGIDSEIIVNASKEALTTDTYNKQTELWTQKRIRVLPTIEVQNERLAGFVTKRQIENLFRSIID